jgi:hypothetical protein
MVDPTKTPTGRQWWHPAVRTEWLTSVQRGQWLFERWLAGFDPHTRVDPTAVYEPWELAQVRRQLPMRGAHRISQLWQGKLPLAAGTWQLLYDSPAPPEAHAMTPICPRRDINVYPLIPRELRAPLPVVEHPQVEELQEVTGVYEAPLCGDRDQLPFGPALFPLVL